MSRWYEVVVCNVLGCLPCPWRSRGVPPGAEGWGVGWEVGIVQADGRHRDRSPIVLLSLNPLGTSHFVPL